MPRGVGHVPRTGTSLTGQSARPGEPRNPATERGVWEFAERGRAHSLEGFIQVGSAPPTPGRPAPLAERGGVVGRGLVACVHRARCGARVSGNQIS